MSDLIKKIKIKKQDGTFTDYIPIGADAINVKVADGESAETKLNKKPYYYNTVADMKDDEKLKVGDMAVTLGYYAANDGGAAEYKIVSTSDTYYETLDNELKAELIIKDRINLKQLGAYGDDTHDDTEKIQSAINLAIGSSLHELLIPNGIYKIESQIVINGTLKIRGIKNAIIRSYTSSNAYILMNNENRMIYETDIENVIFDANNVGDYAFEIKNVSQNFFKRLIFTNAIISALKCESIGICTFDGCYATNSPIGLDIKNCNISSFNYTNLWNNDIMIKFTGTNRQLTFNNQHIEKWGAHCLDTNSASNLIQITFNSNYFLQSNAEETSSNMLNDTNESNSYNLKFNDCTFLFPNGSDNTLAMFKVILTSTSYKKNLSIIRCHLTNRGSLKAWVDDESVTKRQNMSLNFSDTQYAMPLTSGENKSLIFGINYIDWNNIQGFSNYVKLPNNSNYVLVTSATPNGSIAYDDTNGLIRIKSSKNANGMMFIPIRPVNSQVAQSTATDVSGLQTDLNNLISKLYESGIITQ